MKTEIVQSNGELVKAFDENVTEEEFSKFVQEELIEKNVKIKSFHIYMDEGVNLNELDNIIRGGNNKKVSMQKIILK